jgi:tetratricopeptide (TPR) repeat protein
MLLGSFYMDNNIDKAEDAYKKLLNINGDSVEALFNLGRIKFQKGDIEETLLIWRKAVDQEPASFDIRLLICKINVTQGNIEDVVGDCDKLLQILDMPRDMTLDSMGGLAEIFNSISKRLEEENHVQSAGTASKIYEELRQISRRSPTCQGDMLNFMDN